MTCTTYLDECRIALEKYRESRAGSIGDNGSPEHLHDAITLLALEVERLKAGKAEPQPPPQAEGRTDEELWEWCSELVHAVATKDEELEAKDRELAEFRERIQTLEKR